MIGSVVNMRPDLFKTALTEVPFVDALNTMLDSSIPWTAFEWEEWGNPEDPEIYRIMKQYCPYTNVRPQRYPNMLVLGGMNDPRVAFFEPLKWVAKLRSCWPPQGAPLLSGSNEDGENSSSSRGSRAGDVGHDGRMLLLRIEEVGHGGSSGQYAYLEDLAFEYAFLISTLQAPVFRIDKEDESNRTEPLTPSTIRRKKGVFANERLSEMESRGGLGIETDHGQPFISESEGNDLRGANATRIGTSTTQGGARHSWFEALKPGGEDSSGSQGNISNIQNRRRSTTLLEFSEKGTKQNGKPAPPSQGPRAQSRLTEWIANFF